MTAFDDMNGYDALKREQAFNRMFRRCQIANVKMKPARPIPRYWPPLSPHPIYPSPLHDWFAQPEGQYMPKCGCKVGTVCMNVACPNRLIVTCSAGSPSLSNGGV